MADHAKDLDPKDLKKLTRDELDEAAADVGVPEPEALPNKDAVIEAIEAPNPALAPVPEPQTEHTYEVVGPVTVLGHLPRSTFTALIPPEQEALLLESGHLKRINQED